MTGGCGGCAGRVCGGVCGDGVRGGSAHHTPHTTPSHLRVLLGSSNLYVFHHPKELTELAKAGEKPAPVTYDLAQEEVAVSSGFDMSTEGKTKDDILLREDLITLIPMLHEANAMSEELNKKVTCMSHVVSHACHMHITCMSHEYHTYMSHVVTHACYM